MATKKTGYNYLQMCRQPTLNHHNFVVISAFYQINKNINRPINQRGFKFNHRTILRRKQKSKNNLIPFKNRLTYPAL